ncbi:MAG: YggT family protein [bacterium]
MFVVGNFVSALATVIDIVLNIFMILIFVRAIASWFSPDPYNPLYQFLIRVTEPLLRYIRRFIPVNFGMMDITPVIAILIIIFLRVFLVQTLHGIAISLR